MTSSRLSRQVWALCAGIVAGCGEEPAPAPPPPPPVKKKVEEAPVAAALPPVEYAYNPVNKRDPFRWFASDVTTSVAVESSAACTEPLCLLDMDDLTVVAVVSGDANPLAMVEDRAGVGHLVRRNTRVGKGGGKVTQILRDCIVVTSFVSGPDGRSQANKQNLCVKTDVRSEPALDLLKGKEFTQ